MRFYLGEIYQRELPDGRCQAMVVALTDQGRCATLRFIDTARTLTLDWTELTQRDWRRLAEAEVHAADGIDSLI